MATSRRAAEERRAAVELVARCDNRCVFCCRAGAEEDAQPAREAVRERLVAARADADEVTLIGGEPTLEPALMIAAIADARALGFRAIGLQSHGRRLDDPLLAGLVDAGLSDLHLSIHGESAAVHDLHVGIDGAFAALARALEGARRRRLRVVVTTVLTRSNFRGLAGLPRWLRARAVAGWTIAIPRAAGGAEARFEAIVPRLGMAVPHAVHALGLAARLDLPAWIAGAPLCVLGPFRGRALPEAEPRSFAATCEGCSARAACPGLDPIYLARFAGDEVAAERLHPAAGPAAAPAEAALRRLFVGHGPLAPSARPLAAIVDPPRSAASRLRVLEG